MKQSEIKKRLVEIIVESRYDTSIQVAEKIMDEFYLSATVEEKVAETPPCPDHHILDIGTNKCNICGTPYIHG